MFVLEVISGPYRGQAIQLVQGQVITIGRSPECTVTFDDAQLSQRHAEVDWTSNGFSVFDLGSSNGTLINGHRVAGRAGLVLGDHLQIGETILQLADVDLESADVELIANDAPARGQMLAIGSIKTEIAPRQRGLTIVNATRMLALGQQKTAVQQRAAELQIDDRFVAAAAKLKDVVAGGGQGAKVVVQRDGRLDPFWTVPVTIGREHGSGVVIDEAGVSFRHAVVDHREGRYLIRDVGSSNGTFLNGRRVVEERLSDGDVLSVGSYAILVVLGATCLGLDLQPPSMTEQPARAATQNLGMIGRPLGDRPTTELRRKKKASELVWYATSDLDRGVFRARSAILAILIGLVMTGWMLASGDSEILAGNRLSRAHESADFRARAAELDRDQCTACHVGAGRISTLRCLDCHPDNRPTRGHVAADIECVGCHIEHRGAAFHPAAAAILDCNRCHENPHENLVRTAPRLVAEFRIDAPADVAFHVRHESEGVACLRCHAARSDGRSIRNACGQCHAPDHPAIQDCQLCHRGHPDRVRSSTVVAEFPPVEDPPRFAARALPWAFGMLVVSFLFAALLPRRRRAPESSR